MYKMDFILNNNIRFISERFAVAEDFYFNLDCFHFATKVVYTKEKGYYYFQNPQSTCEKYNPKRFERTLNYYDLVSQRINSYGLSDKIGFRMYRSFLMKIRVAIRHIVLSDLSRKEKFKQIREILSNDRVQKVLQEYPIESYSFSMRLLMKQMRKKSVKNVYYLMYF
jgi:stalled ribosome rescue protein Dom34